MIQPPWTFDTIPELLQKRVRATPSAVAFMEKDASGKWRPTTWTEFHDAVCLLSQRLWYGGVRSGDQVALMMANSMQWEIVQHAVLRIGATVIGLDRNDPAERTGDIFAQCHPGALLVDDGDLLQRIPPEVLKVLKLIVNTNDRVRAPGDQPKPSSAQLPSFGIADFPVAPENTATILFTSGTTGKPKAIAYRHYQLAAAIQDITGLLADIPDQAHTACWLPLSNPFQRMLNFCAMAAGWKVFVVSQPAKIMEEVKEIRPHLFAAVPRFYEKLNEGIQRKIARLPVGLKQAALWAQRTGEHHSLRKPDGPLSLSLRCRHGIAEKAILQKIRRSVMGGNLRYLISGSAPMSQPIIRRFAAIGWPILEAYGISENIIPMAMNTLDTLRMGSVGRPLPGNRIRIAADGEVLVKGPGVALEQAAIKADTDGFFPSGDVGWLDGDGFLWLTGRKSDMFKLSTGRKIIPRMVEEALTSIEAVEYAVAAGDNRKYVVALLNIPLAQWRLLIQKHGGADGAHRYLREQVQRVCAHLPAYSRPVDAAVINDCFSPQSGELTSNLKLRRNVVLQKHAHTIDTLYQHTESRSS